MVHALVIIWKLAVSKSDPNYLYWMFSLLLMAIESVATLKVRRRKVTTRYGGR